MILGVIADVDVDDASVDIMDPGLGEVEGNRNPSRNPR